MLGPKPRQATRASPAQLSTQPEPRSLRTLWRGDYNLISRVRVAANRALLIGKNGSVASRDFIAGAYAASEVEREPTALDDRPIEACEAHGIMEGGPAQKRCRADFLRYHSPQSGEAGFGRNSGTGETPSPVVGGTAPLTAGKTNGGAKKHGLATAAARVERDLPGSPGHPLAGGLTGGSDNNTLARVEGLRYSRS